MNLPVTGYVRQTQLIGDRKKGIAGVVPFSHATLWRKVKSQQFPAPIKLSEGITAWRVEDVRAWIEARSSWPRVHVEERTPAHKSINHLRSSSSTYLAADELAELIGCAPNSFACMRRYLERHGWPFEPNLRGFPQVSRAYYLDRMHGALSSAAAPAAEAEPDFSMFEQRNARRK
jgi:predicted DNA-binding transcriptional regulator AlpA